MRPLFQLRAVRFSHFDCDSHLHIKQLGNELLPEAYSRKTFFCFVTKVTFTLYSICDSPLLRSARRGFAPLQKSRRDNPVMSEQKPYAIWIWRLRKSYPVWCGLSLRLEWRLPHQTNSFFFLFLFIDSFFFCLPFLHKNEGKIIKLHITYTIRKKKESLITQRVSEPPLSPDSRAR